MRKEITEAATLKNEIFTCLIDWNPQSKSYIVCGTKKGIFGRLIFYSIKKNSERYHASLVGYFNFDQDYVFCLAPLGPYLLCASINNLYRLKIAKNDKGGSEIKIAEIIKHNSPIYNIKTITTSKYPKIVVCSKDSLNIYIFKDKKIKSIETANQNCHDCITMNNSIILLKNKDTIVDRKKNFTFKLLQDNIKFHTASTKNVDIKLDSDIIYSISSLGCITTILKLPKVYSEPISLMRNLMQDFYKSQIFTLKEIPKHVNCIDGAFVSQYLTMSDTDLFKLLELLKEQGSSDSVFGISKRDLKPKGFDSILREILNI